MSYTPKPSACEGCPAYSWGVGFVPPSRPRFRRSSGREPTALEPRSESVLAEYPTGGLLPEADSTHIVFVGQGPGETEARTSQPFHPNAPSGDLLTRWMYQAGLQRTEVLITNVVQCWLPKAKPNGTPVGNRDPKENEIKHCYAAHLRPLLEQYGFLNDNPDDRKVIVTVGAPASRTLLGDPKVERHLGTMVRRDL